jgi:hypothetical protein
LTDRTTIEAEESDNFKDARKFAWKHFDLHAKQRMEMFRSFITFVAVAYAGFGWSLQAKAYWIGVLLGLFVIFLSFSFFLFDQRIRLLLKISERYLLYEEHRLSRLIGNPDICLFRKSDLVAQLNVQWFRLTYSNLFRGIYLGNIVVSILFLLSLIVVTSTSR